MAHDHAFQLSSRHRQGDLVLSDGSRLFTCTKEVLLGSRTPMLLIPQLLRIDVLAEGTNMRVVMRSFTTHPLSGGPDGMTHRRAKSFDGADQVVTEFVVEPAGGPVGSVDVMIGWPPDLGERFLCTMAATMRRREA
jgi:hypothetical protein